MEGAGLPKENFLLKLFSVSNQILLANRHCRNATVSVLTTALELQGQQDAVRFPWHDLVPLEEPFELVLPGREGHDGS